MLHDNMDYIYLHVTGVSKNGGTQSKRFIVENLIKLDDWGVPLFWETSIYAHCIQLSIT